VRNDEQEDLSRGARTPLVQRPGPLLGLAWGRGHHAWVAAAFGDGTLWRKNLATGATATAARVPPIDRRRLTARDGKLLAGPDGGVVFLHDGEVHSWRADGLLAHAPKPLEEFGEAVLELGRCRTGTALRSSRAMTPIGDRPEISDLVVAFDPETLARMPVRRDDVLRELERHDMPSAARIVDSWPHDRGVSMPASSMACLRVHTASCSVCRRSSSRASGRGG
jgi:hypothetical protein